MNNFSLMKLELLAPLVYAKTTELFRGNEDFLLCFEIDPAQSRSIEPEKECFPGNLVFMGRQNFQSGDLPAETVLLPAGKYLFVQCREALEQPQWIDLAIEQQKDGLWERHKPENRLYVRFLFEDGSPVTQIFRPFF